ncbi:MAG TPA: DUF2203 domain-containing protein [Phycisphaerae bacterium]|jgi:hypothetical protein
MSGSDASASRVSVKPRSRRKTFTVREANCALPLVRRIVADVVEHWSQLQRLTERHQRRGAGDDPLALEDQIRDTRDRLRELVEELNGIGVELKDLEAGLLDFPAKSAGRDVYLCWKLGEAAVDYWHDCSAGFAGRRPISELREAKKH